MEHPCRHYQIKRAGLFVNRGQTDVTAKESSAFAETLLCGFDVVCIDVEPQVIHRGKVVQDIPRPAADVQYLFSSDWLHIVGDVDAAGIAKNERRKAPVNRRER